MSLTDRELSKIKEGAAVAIDLALRHQFAGQAMQAYISIALKTYPNDKGGLMTLGPDESEIAKHAYKFADAMIAEGKK